MRKEDVFCPTLRLLRMFEEPIEQRQRQIVGFCEVIILRLGAGVKI